MISVPGLDPTAATRERPPLDAIFEPGAVAVVGATEGKTGSGKIQSCGT